MYQDVLGRVGTMSKATRRCNVRCIGLSEVAATFQNTVNKTGVNVNTERVAHGFADMGFNLTEGLFFLLVPLSTTALTNPDCTASIGFKQFYTGKVHKAVDALVLVFFIQVEQHVFHAALAVKEFLRIVGGLYATNSGICKRHGGSCRVGAENSRCAVLEKRCLCSIEEHRAIPRNIHFLSGGMFSGMFFTAIGAVAAKRSHLAYRQARPPRQREPG